MSNFFNEVFIICDTREQSALLKNHKVASAIIKGKFLISEYSEKELCKLFEQRPRISHIYNYFSRKGAEVGISKLDRCDYHITGWHRDQEVDLGIEYKQLNDFMSTHNDLMWKLYESVEMFKSVGVFVEGKINIEEINGFYFIKNHCGLDVLRFDLYQARLAEWVEIGIHSRQFDRLDMFGPTLDNLLDYITKSHAPVHPYTPCESDIILKMLSQVHGIKIHTINKLLKCNNGLSFSELNKMDIEELQMKIGKKTGEYLWEVLHGGKTM